MIHSGSCEKKIEFSQLGLRLHLIRGLSTSISQLGPPTFATFPTNYYTDF